MTDPTRPGPPPAGPAPAATGYPYPAQPTNGYPPPQYPQQQSNYYYPNYNNQQPYQQQPPPERSIFLRRLISAAIATFIIIGVILFIVWLVLRPRVPIFTLTSLSVSSLNLTSSSQISASWTANFTVTNPNRKLHVYYDQIIARLYYKSAFITQNELPPFDQRTKTSTSLIATLVASSAYIKPDLATDFRGDRSNGLVKFDVQMIGVVSFNSGGWRARKRYIRVLCDDLPVSVTGNSTKGTLSGGSRRCAVII